MQLIRRDLSRHIALVLTALLVACQPKAIPMTPKETQRVSALTANMTTRCVGRYLIDMPELFVLNSESTTEIEGVKIEVMPMDKWLFERSLEARETRLRQDTIIGTHFGAGIPSLTEVHRLPNQFGVIFDRSRTTESPVLRTLELQDWKEGYFIKATIDSQDVTLAKRKRPELKTNTPEKLAHLLKVYERISGRKDTEIPSTPGLCIPNGFVAGADRQGQETDAVYHLSDAPDVWFGFGSSDATKESTSLFDRAPDVERAMKDGGSKTLRKAKRTINGQEYEEWLFINTPEQDGIKGNMFLMHGNELRMDRSQPFVDFGFHNGNRIPVPELSMEQKDRLRLNEALKKATLSDAEALAIWDKVSATLRPRPAAF